MIAYVVQLFPEATEPLRVDRVGGDDRPLPVVGPTLAAAAHAILTDFTGAKPSFQRIREFTAFAFADLGDRGVVAVTVKEATVARFCEAAGRVSA